MWLASMQLSRFWEVASRNDLNAEKKSVDEEWANIEKSELDLVANLLVSNCSAKKVAQARPGSTC